MACKLCGAESGKYMFCFKCNKLKEEGKAVKCDACGEWHLVGKPCKCKPSTTTKSVVKNIQLVSGLVKNISAISTEIPSPSIKKEAKTKTNRNAMSIMERGDRREAAPVFLFCFTNML